jgi:hypothetical protein
LSTSTAPPWPTMTGKPLNDFQLGILKKLLQIQKLNNHDIAFVFDCDDRTIRRRRYEFAATGDLKKKRDVGKNAEKLKPELLQVCDLPPNPPQGCQADIHAMTEAASMARGA